MIPSPSIAHFTLHTSHFTQRTARPLSSLKFLEQTRNIHRYVHHDGHLTTQSPWNRILIYIYIHNLWLQYHQTCNDKVIFKYFNKIDILLFVQSSRYNMINKTKVCELLNSIFQSHSMHLHNSDTKDNFKISIHKLTLIESVQTPVPEASARKCRIPSDSIPRTWIWQETYRWYHNGEKLDPPIRQGIVWCSRSLCIYLRRRARILRCA